MALSKIVSTSLANGAVSVASITDNTVTSAKLTSTGVVANSYGNTTAIPVITVDAQGRITNATTSSVSGVTGLSYTAANSTVTVSTSTTNFDAVVTSGNSTVQGLLKVIDSVSNTSTSIAASANSVTTAYQLAANAVSNATAYAATAYSNAVATAASDATTKAGTAYSNATSYADTVAGTAYSNAISFANTIAYTAAGTAYSNAVATAASDATTKAGTAYSNAISVASSDATTKAGTAYSNAISYANTIAYTAAGTAYTNAVATAASDATTKANSAYSNVFNGGTFSGAVTVQANLTANSVRMNGNLQVDGDLTVSGNTVTINVTNLNVDDNMIYLNSNSTVSHPDLGFAGNYNDGTYAHAGLFRDATDGVWKFFHGYTPEPDASAFIDTANASFTLSNLQINYVIGNVTGSANSATYLGGNTASTLRSYSDTIAGTAYSNATSYAATIAGTAYSNATSYAATIAGTAYSNAVSVASSDATTKAGTAYSNATAFAANASNISSGTLSASRLPATYLTSVTGTAPVVSSGGSTPAISMAAANSTVAGYMTTTYASKLDGIATGATNVTNNNQLTNGAGYITGYTETDTLATVTARGATTSTLVRINNQLRVGQNTNGTAYIDAYDGYAWFGRDSNTAGIRIDSSGNIHATAQLSTGSYARLGGGTSNPASTGFSHTLAGVSSNRIVNFDGNGNGAPSVWWTSGARAYGAIDAKDPGLTFWTNNGSSWQQQFEINYGNVTINTDIRSPIFYDSNNTGYYVDPNSTSIFNVIGFNGTSANAFGNYWAGTSGYPAYQYTGSNSRFGFSSTSGYVDVYTDGNYYGGIDLYGANRLVPLFDANQGGGALYSSIVYDSSDTAYYLNPNSDSRLVRLSVYAYEGTGAGNGSTEGLIIRGNYNSNTWAHKFHKYDGGSGVQLYLSYTPGDGAWSPLQGWGAGISYTTHVYGSFAADTSVYSPIFYDKNDTGYYTDPNSYSKLRGLTFGVYGDPLSYNGGYYDINFYGYRDVGQDFYGAKIRGQRSNNCCGNPAYLCQGVYLQFYTFEGCAGSNGDANLGLRATFSNDVSFTGNVTAYSSDKRLKTNIRPIQNAMDKVNQLTGFTFNWNQLANSLAEYNTQKNQVGVFAQDVEEVLPEAVALAPFDTDHENGRVSKSGENYLTVQYEKLVPLLIEALKEQDKRIQELEKKLNDK